MVPFRWASPRLTAAPGPPVVAGTSSIHASVCSCPGKYYSAERLDLVRMSRAGHPADNRKIDRTRLGEVQGVGREKPLLTPS